MKIKKEWEEFESAVLPEACGDVQRQEMRRAFYGGCRAMLTMICNISEAAPDEDAGAGQIQLLGVTGGGRMSINDDWCNECHAPIGMGQCDGCCAVACVDADFIRIECCLYCGKEYED